MEQAMEGLSDACMLVDGGDRLVYVNGKAKALLQPKGRILGRKLAAILSDSQVSGLALEAYRSGKPLFSEVTLQLPGVRWRDSQRFHISVVPILIAPPRRLVRIAFREADDLPQPEKVAVCGDAAMQMRNPLTILQGYLENMLDGFISDPTDQRQALITMRKHTLAMERLLDGCK